jgi:hypothetical protein
MTKKNIPQGISTTIYKDITLIWFTLKQLMVSKLNIGVVFLILIPLLLSGMYATGAFKEEEEPEPLRAVDMTFDPKRESNHLENDLHLVNLEIIETNFQYDYPNNNFKLNLEGTTTGQVDFMQVNLQFYYNFNNWLEIMSQMGHIVLIDDEPYIELLSFEDEDQNQINSFNNPTEDDMENRTKCFIKYYTYFEGLKREIYNEEFIIKIGYRNELAYLFTKNNSLLKFGDINFSGVNTSGVWNWEKWSLELEIDVQDLVELGIISSGLTDFINLDFLDELEKFRLYWPSQVTVFIDAYQNSTSFENRVGQTYYSEVISKYGDGGTDDGDDEESGHVIFMRIGRVLYFTFIIPIIILLYISRSVAEDRENRTMTYFLSRPISKPSILFSKYTSAYLAAMLMIIPSMILTYFITSGYKDGMDVAVDNIIILETFIGVTILGLLVYSAIFTLYAALFKHPLIIGLIYSFFFDQLISYLPFKINRMGISYYLVDIAGSQLKSYNAIEIYEPIDPWWADTILCVTTLILIFVSIIFYTEKDFH